MSKISIHPDWLCHRKWWIEGLIVAVILFIVAIVFTWPLGRHLTQAIPVGSEPPTLSMFQLFTTQWTGMALDQGKSYWNAPYFYPHQGVFAWSEPQPFSSVLIWLVAKFTGYILAYNAVLILYLVGFGFSGYAMARLLTDDRVASLWCGVWLTAGAYSLQQLGALHLVAAAPPAACLFFSFFFAKKKKQRFLWLAAFFYVLTWASSEQFGLFLTILLPLTLLPYLFSKKWRWSTLISCFLAIAVALALTLPYLLSQLSYLKEMGFERSLTNVRGVFQFKDFFIPAKGHWLTTHILGWGDDPNIYSWSVGIIPLLVIIWAICLGTFKAGTFNICQKKLRTGLIIMIGVALFLGFGPKVGIISEGKNYSLYALLFLIIPGLSGIRSPARLGMFVTLGIAVLSAPALARIRNRMKTTNIKLMITVALFVFLFTEMWTMPLALVFPNRGVDEHSAVINWLYEHGNGQPLLELPMSKGSRPIDLEPEVWAMMHMLRHQNPIVNGYSGHFPVPFEQLKRAMVVDPAGLGRRYINAYGLRYILVHNHKLSSLSQKILAQSLGDNIAYKDVKDTIYSLPRNNNIQDIKQFLPATAKFRHIPKEGETLGIRLSKPIAETILILPQPNWWIDFDWIDESGQHKTKKVRIRGSVLLDIEHSRLFVRLLRFPRAGAGGEARLISAEEVSMLSQR